jgi:hypothetical protein
MSKRAWIIYDGRAWTMPTEDCSVYEAFSSEEKDTRQSVLKHRDKEWPDGVVYEYDLVRKADGKDWAENETLIG